VKSSFVAYLALGLATVCALLTIVVMIVGAVRGPK
jgi:hypothetical protein